MATVIVMDEAGLSALSREVDEEAVHPLTDDVEADMKLYVPVLTGDLRSTIRSEKLPGEGRVYFGDPARGIDYHLHVEYGTSKMDAQPYARPALYKERSL